MLVHQLMHKVARRHLHRQRHRGLMRCTDHPHCGRALDHLNLGSELEADSLPLVHVKVNSVLTSTRGRRWLLTIPRYSGDGDPMASPGLTLTSVDHKGGGGRSLVAGVGGVVRGHGLTLRPVASHEPRGTRGHRVMTIGLVTQLVRAADHRGGVGAEAAIGGHVCRRLGLIRGHVTLDWQRIRARLSARTGVASGVTSTRCVTRGRGRTDGAGQLRG